MQCYTIQASSWLGAAYHYKEVLNRVIASPLCPYLCSPTLSFFFLGPAWVCSFRQVISSRQGGATLNLDATLHCWIEKQLSKQDRLQRHVAIATPLPGINGTDLKWLIFKNVFGTFYLYICFQWATFVFDNMALIIQGFNLDEPALAGLCSLMQRAYAWHSGERVSRNFQKSQVYAPKY